ncbi:hypothetical protein [Pedobacter caeni]|uniref:Uncharacterized protein n=1 Tax=Pedobacter caeni TaxID=288992 RepID=A0A1M4W2L5_9SPHI|nr:hypothetical protein [Pedobacter caeni]SHE75363.1 hypothetical protein SAMN04488522_1011106 [Pedobacter caeni]
MCRMTISVFLSVVLLSCGSTESKDVNGDTVKVSGQKNNSQEKFDLANMTFKESISDLLKKEGLQFSDGLPGATTLMHYEPFSTSAANLLVFDGHSLGGKAGANDNHLVLHYSTEGNRIDCYEAMIYTAEAASALEESLNQRYGKSVFLKDSGLDTSAIRLDENGEKMKGPREDIKYQRWEDHKNGIAYHLVTRTTARKLTVAEFTAINPNSKDAKNWIQYKMLGFYY